MHAHCLVQWSEHHIIEVSEGMNDIIIDTRKLWEEADTQDCGYVPSHIDVSLGQILLFPAT